MDELNPEREPQTSTCCLSSEVPAKRRFLRELVAGSSDLTPTELGVYAIVMALIYENHGRILYDPQILAESMCEDVGTISRIINRLVEKRKLEIEYGRMNRFLVLIQGK